MVLHKNYEIYFETYYQKSKMATCRIREIICKCIWSRVYKQWLHLTLDIRQTIVTVISSLGKCMSNQNGVSLHIHGKIEIKKKNGSNYWKRCGGIWAPYIAEGTVNC